MLKVFKSLDNFEPEGEGVVEPGVHGAEDLEDRGPQRGAFLVGNRGVLQQLEHAVANQVSKLFLNDWGAEQSADVQVDQTENKSRVDLSSRVE